MTMFFSACVGVQCIRGMKDDKSHQKDLLHIPQQQSKRKEVESLDFLCGVCLRTENQFLPLKDVV